MAVCAQVIALADESAVPPLATVARQLVDIAVADLAGGGSAGVLVSAAAAAWPLIAELQRRDVPYRAHGATLFAGHAVARQLLLGLCAIADRDDGVAEAAILQAPFFAIDLADVVAALVLKDAAADVRRRRVSQARDLLTSLRRRRQRETPGTTAAALVNQTALATMLASLPNGRQHRAVLAALISWIDALAWRQDLDFDAVAACVRGLLRQPERIDLPIALDPGVVQILPMSADVAIDLERAILWNTDASAVVPSGWYGRVQEDHALVVGFDAEPAQIRVRQRLIMPANGDVIVACAGLASRWPGIAWQPSLDS